MAKQSQIGNVPGNILGMYADLSHKLQQGVITERELALILKRQNPFAISSVQEEWQEFYRKYFRLSVDFSEVQIPTQKEDFTRVLIIPKGLTIQQAFQACKKAFPSWSTYNDLDRDVTDNIRNTKASYAISVRDRVEADEELKNLSANHLQEKSISCLTLLERLIYELKYYSETGDHLDQVNITLCAGSRNRRGHVPYVLWRGARLDVDYYNPSRAHARLRARQAVS